MSLRKTPRKDARAAHRRLLQATIDRPYPLSRPFERFPRHLNVPPGKPPRRLYRSISSPKSAAASRQCVMAHRTAARLARRRAVVAASRLRIGTRSKSNSGNRWPRKMTHPRSNTTAAAIVAVDAVAAMPHCRRRVPRLRLGPVRGWRNTPTTRFRTNRATCFIPAILFWKRRKFDILVNRHHLHCHESCNIALYLHTFVRCSFSAIVARPLSFSSLTPDFDQKMRARNMFEAQSFRSLTMDSLLFQSSKGVFSFQTAAVVKNTSV
jgi:hypothetical protein